MGDVSKAREINRMDGQALVDLVRERYAAAALAEANRAIEIFRKRAENLNPKWCEEALRSFETMRGVITESAAEYGVPTASMLVGMAEDAARETAFSLIKRAFRQCLTEEGREARRTWANRNRAA